MTFPEDDHDPIDPILDGDDFDTDDDDETAALDDDNLEQAHAWLSDPQSQRRIFDIKRDTDKRLDVYLQQRLKGISRSRIQRLIDLGGVTLNDKPPKASVKIKAGDQIMVILPPPAIRTIEPEYVPLQILYEDPYLVVVNKQADLLVHPARNHLHGTLIHGLAYHFMQQQGGEVSSAGTWHTRGFSPGDQHDDQADQAHDAGLSEVGREQMRPGVVHRLDRNTTGVMVVAKHDQAHWGLASQFEHRRTLKAYLAVVHGGPDDAAGVIDEPIDKHPTIREAYAVRRGHNSKDSVTIYRVRERYRGYTLLELDLKTGRTHQIRVHLTYMGWPIVGDLHYGGEAVGRPELDDPPIPAGHRRFLTFARTKAQGIEALAKARGRKDVIIAQPALHAAMLGFEHPMEHRPMRFTAPLHEPMATLVRELRQRPAAGPVAKDGYYVELDKLV